MHKTILVSALSLAFLGGAAAGCGQTSYFEVDVKVQSGALSQADCLSKMNSCEVTVSGADSASFTLRSICVMPSNYSLGRFQFATDEDSGNVAFHINIFDGNLKKLGQGDVTAPIKSGGRQPVTLEIVPDVAAFACNAP